MPIALRTQVRRCKTHLGVPPLLTLDADWLRQIREEPVELLQDDWLDVLFVSLQVLLAKWNAGVDDEGGATTRVI